MALSQKESYRLTKEMLFEKYDGKCTFCGCDLGDKWQIWCISPNKTIVTDKKVIIGDDSFENKLPACVSCNSTRNNHCKHGTVEDFRSVLYWEFHFLSEGMTYSTIYKKMVRYGLIIETGNPIVFHFEKMLNNTP